MRIKDYFGAVGSKPLVFGLAWDVTDGVSIDLDAALAKNPALAADIVDIVLLEEEFDPLGQTVNGLVLLAQHGRQIELDLARLDPQRGKLG